MFGKVCVIFVCNKFSKSRGRIQCRILNIFEMLGYTSTPVLFRINVYPFTRIFHFDLLWRSVRRVLLVRYLGEKVCKEVPVLPGTVFFYVQYVPTRPTGILCANTCTRSTEYFLALLSKVRVVVPVPYLVDFFGATVR